MAFNGSKTIEEIDIFCVQDQVNNPIEPTSTMTFAQYGLTNFNVQYSIQLQLEQCCCRLLFS